MIRVKLSRYIRKKPFPKQAAFLCLDKYERVLFGGAAGPGKTLALLMCALQYFDVPGYAAILIRKERAQMDQPGGLMYLAKEWLTGLAHWDGKAWHSNEGATLTFGYVGHDNDLGKLQGSEYHFIGVDEATQLTEFQHSYIASRNRRTKDDVHIPLRMRYCSNPGGPSHEYFKRNFMEFPLPGYIYVPAVIADNPALDQDDYINKKLSFLSPVTRERLLRGDWNVKEMGMMFQPQWFEIVDTLPGKLRYCRFWDMAATEKQDGNDPDWTVGVLLGFDSATKVFYVVNVIRTRSTPYEVKRLIKQTAEIDAATYGNVEIVMEQEGGSGGKNTIDDYTRNVLFGYHFHGMPPKSSKAERAAPVSSYAEAGNVKVLKAPWNRDFLDEVSMFPTDGIHDDQVDGLSGAFKTLASFVTLFPSKPRDVQAHPVVKSQPRVVARTFDVPVERASSRIKRQVGY